MTHSNQKTLRKAAVLLASLESDLAAVLLDELSPGQAALVQRVARELGTIDPREQEEVIHEFLRIGPLRPRSEADGIELDGLLARRAADVGASSAPNSNSNSQYFGAQGSDSHFVDLPRDGVEGTYRAPHRQFRGDLVRPSAANKPFQFLTQEDSQWLAQFLHKERPQTIAVVLSYLPQDQAAGLLGQLSPSLQTEVIQRLVDLDQTDEESLRTVEQQLTEWINDQRQKYQRRSAGVSAVRGILSHLDSSNEQTVMDQLNQRDGMLAAAISRVPANVDRLAGKPNVRSSSSSIPPSRESTLRSQREQQTNSPWYSESSPRTVTPQPTQKPPAGTRAVLKLTWDDLTRSDTDVWASLLQRAERELVVLALAGASNDLVDRVMHDQSAADATALSQQLATLGPTRLSDVEAAQTELAALAVQLVAEREANSAGQRLLAEVG